MIFLEIILCISIYKKNIFFSNIYFSVCDIAVALLQSDDVFTTA